MKTRTFSRTFSLILAVVMCLAMAIPALAATPADATAPLSSISIVEAKKDNYKLSPKFQQNTQVYTVTNENATGVMPTTLAEAEAIIGYTAPAGTTAVTAYDAASQLLTITTTKGGNSTVYYVSFSDIAAASKTNIADINVKKILEADDDAKLDAIKFTYELFPVGIVTNTAPVGTTDIPLATPVAEDGNANNGVVDVTTTGTTQSTMVFDGWENANIPTLSNADAAKINRTDLEGKKVMDGTFSVAYDTVGQYKYLLHEVKGTDTGVTYDDSWYEVTVSAVHADPNDPTSDVVIGWIEVKAVTTYTSNTDYVAGDKVNFGTTTTIDNEKYDNMTTSITYPFINVLATEDLVINKTVTGDLGDKDQEFLFEITVNGTNLAASYDITYTDAAGTHPVTITTDATTGTAYMTLKHGQTATIAKLPVGATYTVTELVADASPAVLASATEAANYNTTITYDKSLVTTEGDTKGDVIKEASVGKTVTNQAILNTKTADTADKNFVSVVNDKPLTPPTGAFMDMVPYIAIVVVAIGGFTVFMIARKRRNAYEA